MRAFDLCPICELPRFAHDWRIFRHRTAGMPFREPFPDSPEWFARLWARRLTHPRLAGPL